MGKYLRAGVLGGAAGGLAMALYLLAVVEPILAEAIAMEEHVGEVEAPIFSRMAQQAGGALGTIVYGVLFGVVLAVVFALVRHRLRGDELQRVRSLATVVFTSAVLVPFLKFPASPPGVGDPATVGRRTALYVLLVGLSATAAWSAWRVRRTLVARGVADASASMTAVVGYVAFVAAIFVLLPGTGGKNSLPAELVWRFRVTSLGGSALLVTVTAVAFAWRLRASSPAVTPGEVDAVV